MRAMRVRDLPPSSLAKVAAREWMVNGCYFRHDPLLGAARD